MYTHFPNKQKNKMKKKLITLALLLALASCTTLRSYKISDNISESTLNHENIQYALPTPMVRIIVQSNLQIFYDSSTLSLCENFFCTQNLYATTFNVPDNANRFYLSYRPNILMHDNVSVTLDDMSFIKQINLTDEDRSAALVTQISTEALQIVGSGNGAVTSAAATLDKKLTPRDSIMNAKKESPCIHKLQICPQVVCNPLKKWQATPGTKSTVLSFSDTLLISLTDLTGGFKVIPINKYITLNGQSAQTTDLHIIIVDEQPTANSFAGNAVSTPTTSVDGQGAQGIYYRPLLGYNISIFDYNNQIKSYQLLVPDLRHVSYFPLLRAPFIKKVSSLSFNNGMLNSFTLDRPSQAEGFISIPIDLAKAIVGIPAELISIKINTAGQNSQLVNAKIKSLQDDVNYKIQLLQYQRQIDSLNQITNRRP